MPRLNPAWVQKVREEVTEPDGAGGFQNSIDRTISVNAAAKALIVMLSEAGRPFKVHNLGAGVKRITTNTDTCPCCKRKL